MEVAVFDTYVNKPNGGLMHFDVLVESNVSAEQARSYGRKYLEAKGIDNVTLTSKHCQFCHIEQPSTEIQMAIQRDGYAIIELQGC